MSAEKKSNTRLVGGAGLAILLAIFVGIVLLSQTMFRGARIDLTANEQYTLNAGTKSILSKIPEPINLYYFNTQETTRDIPAYQAYATRVRELLEEMSEHSGGKLKLTVVDPKPFSEEEDRATGYGLQQVPVGNGKQLFFGLAATNSTNGQAAIPFFQLEKESFVEYDLAKLVQSLIVDKKPVIGVLSSLQLQGSFNPQTGSQTPPWAIYTQIAERFEVRVLDKEVKTIEPDVKVLMLVHPKELSDDALYAVDQFVLKGGRLMVFVDPLSGMDQEAQDPNNPSAAMFANRSSNVEKLFKTWGLSFDPNQIVADRELGVPIRLGNDTVKNPAIIGLEQANMSQSDIATADLESINLDTAGSLALDEKLGLKLEALLSSSKDAALVSAEIAKTMNDPNQLLADFKAAGKPLVLAANISGKFKSAFADRASTSGHLAESKETNTVFVAADTDLMSDRVWVQIQPFFNQQVMNAFANNGDFLVSTVDKLSGDGALISIRARAKTQTGFTTVEALRNQADEASRATEQRLEAELQETERKLAELQASKTDQNQMVLSPEQQTELMNFQKRRGEVRKELRDVRRGLDQKIESLGYWIKFYGTFFMPIVVVFFAIWFFSARARRRVANPA
jgi:ABC-type uncharacterized transport system involved in gliding motility auxiliary subunit